MRVAYLRQSLISQNTFTGEAIIIRNKPWFHPQVVQYEQQCERKALMRSVYRWSVTLYQSSTEYKMSVWASRGEPASPRWINGSTSLTSEEINTLLWHRTWTCRADKKQRRYFTRREATHLMSESIVSNYLRRLNRSHGIPTRWQWSIRHRRNRHAFNSSQETMKFNLVTIIYGRVGNNSVL